MSNKRITDLTELTNPTTDDVFPVVDIATNTTTKVQLGNLPVPSSVTTALATKQDTLVSGTNIKTLNNTSLLGSGNITLTANPSGVAGAIQFSDGSAFASDASNLFWDDTNNRLGIGTNAPTARTHIRGVDQLDTSTSLLVTDSIGTQILRVHNSANNSSVVMTTAKIANYEIVSLNVLSNTSMRFVPTSTGLAISKDYTNPAASTLVHIKGSGSTSATTSLLVQNSTGSSATTFKDDGSLELSNGSINAANGSISASRAFLTNIGSSLINTTSFASSTTFPRFGLTSDASVFLYGGGYNPTSGSGVFNVFHAQPTINQTGGANGITRGLFIDPTLTAAADFRAIEVTNGNVLIGNSASNTAKLSIKGSGSTSATTALLVQNSLGTAVFAVRDGGADKVVVMPSAQIGSLEISGTSIAAGGGATISFPSNRIFLGSGSVETSARLQVDSTTQGFLPPRMTTTQRNAIASPASGLIIYNTTTNKLNLYTTTWETITSL
jgi:hypothetical protein